jgi:hypothetical protein
MWVFQAPERPGPRDPRTNYRRGFHDYVIARFPLAHVLLLEPDPIRLTELQELWRDHPNVEIVPALWCEAKDCPGEHRFFRAAVPDGSMVYSDDARYAQRFAPDSVPIASVVPCRSLVASISDEVVGLISLDVAVPSQYNTITQGSAAHPLEVAVTVQDAPLSNVELSQAFLLHQGYVRAGRAWGSAESGMSFVRTSNVALRLSALRAQAQVEAGTRLVRIRDRVPIGNRFTALRRKATALLDPRRLRKAIIDPSFGLPVPPINRAHVEDVIKDVQLGDGTFEIEMAESNPDDIARECFAQLGVFPISFSYPDVSPLREPTHRLSPIIPGFPYTFDDEAAYMSHYASYQLAITHRKAGWDCFRHVEIGASGAIPLMVDANEIPPYCMVHYPKRAFRQIAAAASQGKTPGPKTRELLRNHFSAHQTTRAMAEYILRMANLEDARRILFVDASLPTQADYLSVLSLVGLKQLFGDRCDVLFPTPYLYEDQAFDPIQLYGRGFGYAQKLDANLRSILEEDGSPSPMARIDQNAYDAVVVGSYYRNHHLVPEVINQYPHQPRVLLYGEDTPPTEEMFRRIRADGTHVFMRPIHTKI